MNNQDYLKLRDGSKTKTFVTRNRKQLHEQVRDYLNAAVSHYAGDEGSHKLDARIGIQVAIDFKPAYMPHVRAAMSKVNGEVVWQVNAGNVEYKKLDEARKPVALETVLDQMNRALDKLDEESAPAEIDEATKLSRAAKRRLTTIANASDSELGAMIDQLKDLNDDEFANLSTVINMLQANLTPQLDIAA